MNPAYLFIIGSVVFTVLGQIIIKWRISHFGALPDENIDRIWFVVKTLFDPYIMVGLGSAVIASMFWIATMSKLDISDAYPFITAGLVVLTVAAGVFLFHESLTLAKAGGILLICCGVVLTSQSG